MSLGAILLIVLILMLLGALPVWPHAQNFGYTPVSVLGVVVVVMLILLVTGRL